MIVNADVLDWAAEYEGPPFHALLADPPYHLGANGFMNKKWDAARYGIAFKPETWAALAEHLHPGAFGMAFASSRGWHRLAVAIEDAGLRIHPSIFGWSFGSGFPKATRIDTQIDKAAGAEREVVGKNGNARPNSGRTGGIMGEAKGRVFNTELTAPATPLAAAWEGHRYGLQAMKPALEPIIVFQKPYQSKPVEDITATGAGALFIDGGRIEGVKGAGVWGSSNETCQEGRIFNASPDGEDYRSQQHQAGRWPANFALVHHPDCQRVGVERVRGTGVAHGQNASAGSVYGNGQGLISQAKGDEQQTYADPDGLETVAKWDCVPECSVRRLGEQSGVRVSGGSEHDRSTVTQVCYGRFTNNGRDVRRSPDTGTAARFFFQADYALDHADPVFYCAKASRKERDAGLGDNGSKPPQEYGLKTSVDGRPGRSQGARTHSPARNPHPTVKPIALAKWLATLLLPPPEYAPRRILVPFMGSGSECIGAALIGWEHITGIDSDPEAVAIAEARLAHWLKEAEKPQQLELIHG